MLKNLTVFALFLVAIGVGLNVYLPPYLPVEVPPPHYTVLNDSLSAPIKASSLLSSTALFGEISETAQYGIQLALFASLLDAKRGSEQWLTVNLPTMPVIFKAASGQRQWYVLATGPLASRDVAQKHQRLLQEAGFVTEVIIWPVAPDSP